MQSCNQLSGHISSGGAQPRPSPTDGGHFVLALPGRPAGFRAAAEADLLPSLIPSLFVRKVQGCPLVYTHAETHRHTHASQESQSQIVRTGVWQSLGAVLPRGQHRLFPSAAPVWRLLSSLMCAQLIVSSRE